MPKYEELAQKLRGRILDGVYRPGDRLPSENALTASEGLSRQTVRQALSLLEREGRITRRRGSGSVVRAGGPRRPRTHSVAVVTTYIGEYIFPDILRGIEEELARGGCAPILRATRNRADSERAILEDLLTRPVDGVIAEGTRTALPNPNLDLYRRLADAGVPLVSINGFYADCPPDASVVADDRAGGAMAAEYLLAKGHTRIAGVFKSDDIQGHRRYAGFTDALRRAKTPVSDDHILWYTTETRRTLVAAKLADTLRDCTAAVCYNDEVALQILAQLREAGVRVPQQMALVGFDASTFGAMASPPLTSLALDCPGRHEAIGRLAAADLLGLIEGGAPESAVLPWRVVERGSA